MVDSKVMREDSHVMKTLSVLAMIFLPFSVVTSIFGTQFFSNIPSTDGGGQYSTSVSSNFWILWAIAVPFTLVLVTGWRVWIRWFQPNVYLPRKSSTHLEFKGITALEMHEV
jgi:Mg2+ and Co2+ transporter CorA